MARAHSGDGGRYHQRRLDGGRVVDLSGATAPVCAAQKVRATTQSDANSPVSEGTDLIPLVCGATKKLDGSFI